VKLVKADDDVDFNVNTSTDPRSDDGQLELERDHLKAEAEDGD